MSNLRINPNCCDLHSRHYKPSVISQFLVEYDEQGNVIRFNNDIKLLLRQKDLHKSIGYDCIRQYVDSIQNAHPVTDHNLTDDELMSLIPPHGLSTITDVYQYSKFLEENSKFIKDKYEEIQSSYKKREDFKKRFKVDF